MPKQTTAADDAAYPSLAWVIIPILLVPLGLFIRSHLAARKLARTGIGRGAPGFQTSVRRIAVTPEIARRLRAGEEVSPEEIAEAQAAAAAGGGAGAGGAGGAGGGAGGAGLAEGAASGAQSDEGETEARANEENEWLPEELRKESKGGTRGRKGKKRR